MNVEFFKQPRKAEGLFDTAAVNMPALMPSCRAHPEIGHVAVPGTKQ